MADEICLLYVFSEKQFTDTYDHLFLVNVKSETYMEPLLHRVPEKNKPL